MISEIMYDPASEEAPPVKTEWVELFNSGDAAVDVSGWYLQDEDGRTGALPEGVVLAPHQAVVLIPAACSVEAFRAAWGEGFDIHPVTGWGRPGLSGLANRPTAENEILTLRRADGEVVHTVNFEASSPWPSGGRGGPSIYVLPTSLNPVVSAEGANWRYSAADVHGARQAVATEVFDSRDVGSPGVVAMEE